MEIPRHWRLKAQRYRLEGSACPTCGQLSFPPRPVCPHCTAQPARIDAQGIVPVGQEQFTAKQVFEYRAK